MNNSMVFSYAARLRKMGKILNTISLEENTNFCEFGINKCNLLFKLILKHL